MRFSRLANLIAAIGVVLALAGAATALAAARDPGVTAPAPEPIARSSVHSVTNAPEADGASTLPETGVPSRAETPPESPTTPLFVKTGGVNAGPTGADAVLETVNPSVPVEGPDLWIGTASAARDAAGRDGAGPPAQAAPVTSFDITLSPGANLISFPLIPDDSAIEAVLAGILDRVETVWQYDTSGAAPRWRSYAPGAPSDLRVMRDGPGYWVHLKDDGTGDEALTITGGEATGPARRVVQGWNLVGFTATTAGDAATDRAALAALYNATDGANWRNKDNWLSNAPMVEWRGVTTDSDGRVTYLNLYNNQLTGEIPAELGSLTSLEGLRLYNNQLTGEIPAELGSLTNLKVLLLNSNQLTGEIPAELGSLTNLKDLRLLRNQLTGEIPAELGSLTSLEGLHMDANRLTGEIPAELGNLTNLKGLFLSFNRLTGEIPSELGNLTNLERLDLSFNWLTGEIPSELGNLTNLEGLWLGGHQLTGCIPNGLRGIETNDLSQLGLPFCDMPGAPTIATPIVPGDASLTVAWAAPINTGSSAITAYDLRYIETGAADKSDANWTVVEDVWAAGSGSLQYTLSGLTGGTQYDVQVRAVNAAGASAWSATVTGTTASAVVPGAPTGLTAAVAAGKAQVVLSWIAPTDTGGAPITGYKIEASDDGNNPWTEVYTTTGDATGYTDEGTDNNGPMFEVGTTRHYRVSAINSVGTGPPSNVAVTEGLVDRYDTNNNGTIEKNEVINAINDYLFGEGDAAISKGDVIRLINLYLFG